MRLAVSLATRGRPQQLLDTIARDLACFSRADTAFVIQVDDDDKPTIDVLSKASLDPRVTVNVQPREDTVAAKWNSITAIPADVYTIAGDDDPFITPDTDEKILAAGAFFPDGIGMVYGHLANASFTSVVSMTAKMVEKRDGVMMPEHFPYWFCDHWTDDLARIMGRISVADIRTDQSRVGKTQELREPWWWATWFDAAYRMRRQEAYRLIDELDEPGWRKDVQRNSAPIVEFRSRWINENVRNSARSLEGFPPPSLRDERYQRVKQKAIDLVPHLLDDCGMSADEASMFRKHLLPPKTVIGLRQAFA